MVDRAHVQDWLDRYVRAWASYDEGDIGELFSEDVEYRYHPEDDPVVGREAVVKSWTEPEGDASTRDEPGTWTARYEAWAVDGDRAVAFGRSDYVDRPGDARPARVYDNVFLLEFDADGRCRRFTELFRQRPDAATAG